MKSVGKTNRWLISGQVRSSMSPIARLVQTRILAATSFEGSLSMEGLR